MPIKVGWKFSAQPPVAVTLRFRMWRSFHAADLLHRTGNNMIGVWNVLVDLIPAALATIARPG
jgi:hypothetical protein